MQHVCTTYETISIPRGDHYTYTSSTVQSDPRRQVPLPDTREEVDTSWEVQISVSDQPSGGGPFRLPQ